METEDRSDLTKFLDEFKKLVEEALRENRGFLPDRLIGPLNSAWAELEPRFEEIKAEIAGGTVDDALEDEGLSGDQLRAKRVVWENVLEALAAARRGPRQRLFGRLLGWGGRVLRLFKTALGLANTILESMGKAIPPVGAVKEFKGTLEAAFSLKEQVGGPIRRFLSRIS